MSPPSAMTVNEGKLPVTVIIATRQEASNIGECLASVRWADQVFVVDSQSTDGTVEKAEAVGAAVVQFTYQGGWPKKKNWALKTLSIRNPWTLILDADERIEPDLADEIAKAIDRPECDGYYIRWKFMFLGTWMKHSWRHGWMLRLFRTGLGEYEDLGLREEGGWDNEVHENVRLLGRSGRLKSYLLHESRASLDSWIAKQNAFSTWNAARRLQHAGAAHRHDYKNLFSADPLAQRRSLKAIYLHLPGKPFLMFLYLYLLRGGFLDGRAGYYFCALRAAHELNIEAKMYERRLAMAANPQQNR
jgi:glycosyltransferase involved in cell wall biosynthesis